MQNLLSKDLKAAVKTVVGTCGSLGVLVESKSPTEVEQEIDRGKYDKEIESESTETPEDKRAKLDEYFKEVSEEQEKIIKQEKEAKEAEAEKKEEAEAEKPAEEDKEEKEEEKK